ncbi:MAG: RNA polymerase sigma factor [Gammaproteobacteria bacterium]
MSYSEDDVALLEAWRQNRVDLIRFLARRLRCEAAAKDIAQEIWFRLRRVNREPRHKNPRALLFHIAANLATDHHRVEHRRIEIVAEVHDLLWGNREEASTERRVIAAETLKRLEAAIERMPERSREIFRLNRFDGLTQREIAERLGISLTAVEKNLQKAFAQLAAADIDDDI